MTLFGWIYLICTVIYMASMVILIDKPRNPITREAVIGSIIGQGLSFWALYAWGIHV